jgi:hypothetical protein
MGPSQPSTTEYLSWFSPVPRNTRRITQQILAKSGKAPANARCHRGGQTLRLDPHHPGPGAPAGPAPALQGRSGLATDRGGGRCQRWPVTAPGADDAAAGDACVRGDHAVPQNAVRTEPPMLNLPAPSITPSASPRLQTLRPRLPRQASPVTPPAQPGTLMPLPVRAQRCPGAGSLARRRGNQRHSRHARNHRQLTPLAKPA